MDANEIDRIERLAFQAGLYQGIATAGGHVKPEAPKEPEQPKRTDEEIAREYRANKIIAKLRTLSHDDHNRISTGPALYALESVNTVSWDELREL